MGKNDAEIDKGEPPRCPRCKAWLAQSKYKPVMMAIVDPTIRYAVCCPGCNTTCVVASPAWPQQWAWEDIIKRGEFEVEALDDTYDWNEIERLQKEGVVR